MDNVKNSNELGYKAATENSQSTRKERLRQWRDSAWKELKNLRRNESAYFVGIALLVVVMIFEAIGFPGLNRTVVQVFVTIAIVVLAMVLIMDVEALFQRVKEVGVAKVVLLLVGTAGSAIALGTASQTVNAAVGVDPNHFGYTVTVISVLLLPIAIYLALTVAYVVVLVGGPLAVPLLMLPAPKTTQDSVNLAKNGTGFPRLMVAARMLTIVVLYGFMTGVLGKPGSAYEAWTLRSAKYVAFHLEMYSHSHCRLKSGERYAPVEGDVILVGSVVGDGFRFVLGTCLPPSEAPAQWAHASLR